MLAEVENHNPVPYAIRAIIQQFIPVLSVARPYGRRPVGSTRIGDIILAAWPPGILIIHGVVDFNKLDP